MIHINFLCVFEFTEEERQLGKKKKVPNFKTKLSLLVL